MKIDFLTAILSFSLLLSVTICHSQDTKYPADTDCSGLESGVKPARLRNPYPFIYHFSGKFMQELYEKYAYLKTAKLTIGNYTQYYTLGTALWHLSKIEEAEKIFLTIENSEKAGPDFFSDTFVNNHRNGYYFSGYKYNACIYLAKIYTEKNEFAKALAYLDKATSKYRIEYGCTINSRDQTNECLSLYSVCSKELKLNKKYVDVALPEFIIWHDDFLIKSIKGIYNSRQIADSLVQAAKSITYTIDSLPSVYYYSTENGSGGTKQNKVVCHPSWATINLFGRKARVYHQFDSIEISDKIKDLYLNLFKESEFYKALCKEEWITKAN